MSDASRLYISRKLGKGMKHGYKWRAFLPLFLLFIVTALLSFSMIPEDSINAAFQAAAEAAHEAILNSMVCAESTRGIGGEMYYSLSEFLPELLERQEGSLSG